MELEVENIENRIKNLEKPKHGNIKFFLQYILSPLLVVVIGVIVNLQIENDKKEMQQLEIAQSMLSTLFADDEYKTLVTQRLLYEVIQDDKLKNEIRKIVKDYISHKYSKLVEKGDLERAAKVYQAVTDIADNNNLDLIKYIKEKENKEKTLTKFEKAKTREEEGFIALVNEDYPLALEKFKEAYEVYPKYHTVYEIHKLLKKNIKIINNKNIEYRVIKEIVEKYSWKAPKDSLNKLREKISNTSN